MIRTILITDASINLILGLPLMIFPQKTIRLLGAPITEQFFYPSIIGAILTGIGIALLVECFKRPKNLVGLGLGGAVVINLCAGLALGAWLVWGNLNIPFGGQLFLWLLVTVLILISIIEIIIHLKK